MTDGLRDSSWITNEPEILDAVIRAVLHVIPIVRYAAVIRKPGKPAKVIAYIGRYLAT